MRDVTIKLNQPVEYGSETIAELTLREPRVKHLRGLTLPLKVGAEDGSVTIPLVFNDVITLASRISGQPTTVIDELGLEDAAAVGRAVSGFLPESLTAGET